ncbi:hypothetical protein, conserved [Babesia ovata]|uniref:Uncharacterized protein n=1 Tax=Babesia ovata TaxID=189622 RepID=A0A2H6KKG4_9APIC|nr:uncharacterized protein BOVATA_049650 [Babesia ovata]GBE63472.1 hypothetical protein, conserved [Babesia ovata]
MGFGDISVIASHRSTGKRIKDVLADFCGDSEKPLIKLCSYMLCLLRTPPKSLGDMFAFYYNFILCWGLKGNDHKSDAFKKAVAKAYFGETYPKLDITSMFRSQHHAADNHPKGDLFSLFSCDNKESSATTCGRYLKPISLKTWTVFSEKNADNYLSWVLYLTETFYNLLDQLWKECCDNCNKPGTRCHGNTCYKNCQTLQNPPLPASAKHHTLCKSIAQCPFTRPTICTYGFVIKSSSNLSDENGVENKRTCKDFCRTLENVLSKVKDKNDVLAKLVFETIPEYLWQIRLPFSYLLLALWSLSLLYLLHIAVVRLDVLRIRSHLKTPSSHRIAAQSLLAAARVKALANVKYFSP